MSSQSSALAGALTLPSQTDLAPDATRRSASVAQSTPLPGDQPIPLTSQETGEADLNDVDAPFVPPQTSTDTPSASTGPTRYCSVKGCKAAMPRDYFFKMCQPCRDRYRGYGITKRAKWRAERVAANAELEALRVEEDKRRAEEGLPVDQSSHLYTNLLTF